MVQQNRNIAVSLLDIAPCLQHWLMLPALLPRRCGLAKRSHAAAHPAIIVETLQRLSDSARDRHGITGGH
eukprot:1465655-Amphidinium_carterae.1